MTHHFGKAKRIITFLLAFIMLFGTFSLTSISSMVSLAADSSGSTTSSIQDVLDLLTSDTYSSYSAIYADRPNAKNTIELSVADFLTDDPDNAMAVVLENFKGSTTPIVVMGNDGKLTWKFTVAESAKYAIKIEYYTKITETDVRDAALAAGYSEDRLSELVNKTSAIERMLFVDDEILFSECRSLKFPVSWSDEYILTDDYATTDGKTYANGSIISSTSSDFYNIIKNPANAKASELFGARIFFRDYSEESYESVKYENRNEMRPSKAQVYEWITQNVEDSAGYYTDPLLFYLEEGEHTISLDAVREPFAIKSITLYPYEDPITYQEYLAKYSDAKDATGSPVVIQAEYSYMTSSQTIYQLSDTSSPISQPSDTSRERLNSIGGDKWQYAGDWISWQVEVPESGFYDIIPRSIQNFYSGSFVSRALYVNGELPFAEASKLRFNYSKNWQTTALNAGVKNNDTLETYKIYLEEGMNIITLKVVLGDMGVLLSQIEESMNIINGYRRQLLMVTGPDPDEYRDYAFDKTMPSVLRGFKAQSRLLYSISAHLEEIIGSKGDHTILLDKTAWILDRMGSYPTKIASLMDDLKDYIGSLGTWLMSTQNQPLLIDYFSVQAPGSEAPQADAGFFQSLFAEIRKFIASFFADYNTIGAKTKEEYTDASSITAWIVTGRDNAKILRTMINDFFITETNIQVNLRLVAAGTLLPATLAGTGPDVSFSTAAGDTINFAIRSAVLPLNEFNDIEALDEVIYGATGSALLDAIANDSSYYKPETFDEVMSRFSPSALTPITLYGNTYGVPESQSFSMLFYRKDILAEKNIEVPKTWDEFYDAIFSLQADNLDIGFPNGLGGTMLWMYQLGEPLYQVGNYEEYAEQLMQLYPEETVKRMLREEKIENYESLTYMDGLVALNKFYVDSSGEYVPTTDGMEINLGSDTALRCFKEVCDLFTMWEFPVTFDFANRFRSGEMPMAIMDYTAYNQLIVFAPEIKGLWEFTTLPGTVINEQGDINYNSVSSVSCIVMMRGVASGNDEQVATLKKKNAWSFMSWWTGAEAQSKYATEMESLLGPSAKQATANLEALYSMPWSTSEYKNLSDQYNHLTATPEFPGSYIISRYGSFAFLAVYNDKAEPVETLQGYLDDINKELTRKRLEFNLPTMDDFRNLDSENG